MLIQKDYSLDQAFKEVFDQLKHAGVDKSHKFRFFSVATVNASDGSIPQNRMVVLRSFNDDWTFEFYTDHRTSKVKEIKNNPVISTLFWDLSKRVQIRIEADTNIHNQDEISAARWKDVQGDAQKAYTSLLTPGTPVNSPEDAHKWPDPISSDHFSVVVCSAHRIKALQISGMEHIAFEGSRLSSSDRWKKMWITS